MMRIGSHDLGMTSVVAFALPSNVASRRVMQKIGMRYEGVIEHAGIAPVGSIGTFWAYRRSRSRPS